MDDMIYKPGLSGANPDSREFHGNAMDPLAENSKTSDFWSRVAARPRLPPGPAIAVIVGTSLVLWGGVIGLVYVLWR